MKNRIKNNKGYSLVELLGVMVILGMLLSLGIIGYTRYRKQAANKSYDMMSKNAASAAEEYFMDHIGAKEVTLKTLVDNHYLEPTKDPMAKNKLCEGSVKIFDTQEATDSSLEVNTYKVVVKCKKYDNCSLYPSDLECDSEGGLVTNGTSNYYSLGLKKYDFGSNMAIAIRVKFNDFPADRLIEYYGNWESAGGGLGINKNHDFYFNLYSRSSGGYYSVASSIEAKINRWYIVVGVLDNGILKLYIDGQLQGTNELPGGNVKPSPYDIIVGGNPASNGRVEVPAPITSSNALVFDRALTQEEINNYFSTPNLPINYNQSDASLLVNKVF